MNKNHSLKAMLLIGLALGFGFTISVVSAGPPIAVTSAVPDQAEQDTEGLTVIINGRGFDKKMEIKFCRSGTNQTCVEGDDGGVDINVVGPVKVINSKKIEITVDVGLEAEIGNFDIEAISLSSPGRRGRGTEKFSVVAKGGGNDGNLQAKFDLTIIDDDGTAQIQEDGKGPYVDSTKGSLQVSTGPGPGFRFDNNLKKHYSGRRAVYMSVGSEGGVPNPRSPYEIDFRFDLVIGLDLGGLAVGESGTVAASLIYYNGQTISGSNDQVWGRLIFGDMSMNFNETTPDSNPDDHDNHVLAERCVTEDSSPINVTRTGQTTWTLASNDTGLACRFAMVKTESAECMNTKPCAFSDDDIMSFKFQFDLVQQE